jgi:formamidopyrimidine-DNA glycosylase
VPELPEVEVLIRHLRPLLSGRTIRGCRVIRPKVLRPTSPAGLIRTLTGARFLSVKRRGKCIVFQLQPPQKGRPFVVIGHLGMTGRMYLQPRGRTLPKHCAVVLNLGPENFIYEDTRYFGRFTLDDSMLKRLGPEPLGVAFTAKHLAGVLGRSRQAIKVRLLDQRLAAGIGNIYASEILFRAGISPSLAARRLVPRQIQRLWQAVRHVLAEAIVRGSTLPLSYAGGKKGNGLFYFGVAQDGPVPLVERLLVYDRRGLPCLKCKTPIQRIVQGARSTFFCPSCQKRAGSQCQSG